MLVSPGDLLPTHNPTDGAECEPTNPVTRPCFVAGDIKIINTKQIKTETSEKHKQIVFISICLLRFGVLRVFVLFCVLVFVRAILSWCP